MQEQADMTSGLDHLKSSITTQAMLHIMLEAIRRDESCEKLHGCIVLCELDVCGQAS